jgi:hypothetical protein
MDNEIKKRKYYIYENIDKLKDHNQIINLIKLKHCKYTENGNGIFLNISKLDDEIINIIYQLIMNTLDYKEDVGENFAYGLTDELEKDEFVKEDINHAPHKGYMKEYVYSSDLEELLLKNYSNEEQEIIRYSKKYHL